MLVCPHETREKGEQLRHDLGIGPASLLSCSRRDGPGRPANTASTGAENVHGRGDVFQCLPQLRQPINRAWRAGASQGCGSHLHPIPSCIGCQANQCSCVPRGVPFLVGQWAVQKAKRQTARSKSGASQKPVCRVPLIIHAPPSHRAVTVAVTSNRTFGAVELFVPGRRHQHRLP